MKMLRRSTLYVLVLLTFTVVPPEANLCRHSYLM